MANITSIYSCFWLSSLQNCGEGWAGGMGVLSSAALSLQTMRAAVGGSTGLWCLMIRKLVACNGAATRLIMQNRQVRVGQERQRKHFWAPGRLMRGQLFVCVPRHLLPETSSELPPLMKFDIVEMTGAMTALSQDRVRGGWGGGGLISYHTCALLLCCSKVRAWWKCWWFPSRQAIHHSAVSPQRRALSGIMTLADLNNCAASRRKHGMDLDLMEFKPCTVDRGWNQTCAPVAAPTLIPIAFLGWFLSWLLFLVFFLHGVTVALSDLPKLFHGLILSLWIICLCFNCSARHAPPLLFWDCRHCAEHWCVIRLECMIWFCLSIFMH